MTGSGQGSIDVKNLHNQVQQATLAVPEGGTVEFSTDELTALWSYMQENEQAIQNGPANLRGVYSKFQQAIPQSITSGGRSS